MRESGKRKAERISAAQGRAVAKAQQGVVWRGSCENHKLAPRREPRNRVTGNRADPHPRG